MENRSRVCDIKKKFECLNVINETPRQCGKVLSPNSKVNPNVTYAEPLKNHSNKQQSVVTNKCHIKRSNAFRSDKPVPSGVRTAVPSVDNPENNTELLQEIVQLRNICSEKKGSHVINSDKYYRHSNSSVATPIEPGKSESVEYAQVIHKRKLVPSLLKSTENNKSPVPNGIRNSIPKDNPIEASRFAFGSPQSGSSDIVAQRIMEVLKTPLPKGPPPKKPLRTFKHVVGQVIASNKESPNRSPKHELKLALSSDGNVPFPVLRPSPPVRSKTEPELILNRVGSNLSYNRCNNVPVQVPNIKKKEGSPRTDDNANKPESFLCLNSLNCTSGNGSSKNVYDVPFEPKSLFFVDLSRPKPVSPTGQNTYGLLKKPLSTDHIYSEPYTPRLSRKTKAEQTATAILNAYLSEQKKINSDSNVKQNKTSSSISTPVSEKKLYYMSSPIPKPEVKLLSSTGIMADHDNNMNVNNGLGLGKIDLIESSPVHEFQKVKSLLRKVYGEMNTKNGTDSDTDSVNSMTDDIKIESVSPEQLTARRKGYVQKMSSCRRLHSPVKQRADRLFDVLLLIGLNIVSKKIPYIKLQYPESASLPAMIEDVCFPDASDWPPTEDYLHTNYTTILTNANGERKYAYCRRIMPEGSEVCVPLVYCVVTSHRSNGFYYKVLMEIENHHGLPENNFKQFIHSLYNCKFPSCGEIINLPSDVSLKRPKDWREEYNDLARVIKIVSIPTFLKLFAALLLERKVVVIGSNISKVSDCIEGLQTALFPFNWQHTLITILPKSMLELLNAPTPYLIGIVKRPNEELSLKNIDEVLIVNIDKGSNIIQKVGDENSILPKKLYKCMRSALKICLSSEENNLLASEIVMRFFTETVGHFRCHIITSTENGQRHFEKESFVKGVECHSIQLFLEWFSETSMFEVFILSETERSKLPGIFEERCAELVEEATKNSHKKGKNIKTVKNFGERFIDWAGSPGFSNKI